ncbi:hypothetical protein [Rathayibacter soli]|uniref:hypothetical protein n=1 Tax=Rathayibacter soli TaxID=3144168 RepID=UPI0027E559CF|nr:hypothetical protein [Glaciibacter superstes]
MSESLSVPELGTSAGLASLALVAAPRIRYRMFDAVFTALSEAILNLQPPPATPISAPVVAAALKVSRAPSTKPLPGSRTLG